MQTYIYSEEAVVISSGLRWRPLNMIDDRKTICAFQDIKKLLDYSKREVGNNHNFLFYDKSGGWFYLELWLFHLYFFNYLSRLIFFLSYWTVMEVL